MSRDQRLEDNWALVWALEEAKSLGVGVCVAFCLIDRHLGAPWRHYEFMLRGLSELHERARDLSLPFHLLWDDPLAVAASASSPPERVAALARRLRASRLVCDFSPLRHARAWVRELGALAEVPVHLCDAHNVVPCWLASDKAEVGARTLRPRLWRHAPEFLVPFPDFAAFSAELRARNAAAPPAAETNIDWAHVREVTRSRCDEDVGAVALASGERAARARVAAFCSGGLRGYAVSRNLPHLPGALSLLSPYLHFGQLAPQRAILDARAAGHAEEFVEEAFVRRELSDNFCYFNERYDSLEGAARWARETLQAHAADRREYVYSLAQLERAETHDDLWNAAQEELVHAAKMHGYLRMYWAKKILEWSESPEAALRHTIALNDKYSLDGRDPNGFVGAAWSVCGVHDRGWTERPVFGKIRYMNYNGCKRKFDIQAYINSVKKLKK